MNFHIDTEKLDRTPRKFRKQKATTNLREGLDNLEDFFFKRYNKENWFLAALGINSKIGK